jgi:hypothetical protein
MPRLFAQLDDGAIAAQFSTRGRRPVRRREAPGPWRVAQHAHWHAPWAGETVALSALPSGSSLPS